MARDTEIELHLCVHEDQRESLPENLKKWETGFVKSDTWLLIIYNSLKNSN